MIYAATAGVEYFGTGAWHLSLSLRQMRLVCPPYCLASEAMLDRSPLLKFILMGPERTVALLAALSSLSCPERFNGSLLLLFLC
jgi:hypothetical protein